MAKKPVNKKAVDKKKVQKNINQILQGTSNSTGLNKVKKMKQTPEIKKLRTSLENSLKKERAKLPSTAKAKKRRLSRGKKKD